MIVELELKLVADRYGVLTPELALGYRCAIAARNEFETVDDVSALSLNSTAALFAIKNILDPEECHVRDYGKHIYLFFHSPTGSILRLEALPTALPLPLCCTAVENNLLRGKPVEKNDLLFYQEQVDVLIGMVLSSPEKDLFSIRRHRVRPAGSFSDALCRFEPCERCGTPIRLNRLFDVEGFRLCAQCAEIEPSWFENEFLSHADSVE